MRSPRLNFFEADWARKLNRETRLIYPMPVLNTAVSLLLAPIFFGRRFFAALANAVFSRRESFRVRIAGLAHFVVACHWARSLRKQDVSLIHSQWIQSGGTIGMYGAWLIDVPFSFTGHAVDLFRERAALNDKIARANFIVCISNFHRQFYLDHGARLEQLLTAYCGIDVDQFEFEPRQWDHDQPHIISLGRLVEKKGFDYLIDACAILRDRGIPFRCTIAGDGPLETRLRNRVSERSLMDVVEVPGKAISQEDLAAFLHSGHIFAQPCVWSRDNDVDGTPRSLMEAMACGLPSVSTRIAGIPDVIEDGVSGLLVDPNDAAGLADALETILRNPSLADRISRGGRARIEAKFNLADCLDPLVARYRETLGQRGEPMANISSAQIEDEA
jgi:glycosyltransferase involved in cell wall biosynthesis